MGKYDLRFDTIESGHSLIQLRDFLITHPGTYDFESYVQWTEETCIPGIGSGERRALAWWQNGLMIGDAVLKVPEPNKVELKNFRVDSPAWLQNRGLGDFLMRQTLREAVSLLDDQGLISNAAQAITVILDTTAGNPAVTFFKRHGFEEIERAELYTPGQTEIVMQTDIPLEV